MNQPLADEKVTPWMSFRFWWLDLCGWPEACVDKIVIDGEKKSPHKNCTCVEERDRLYADLKTLMKDGEL